MRLQFEVVSSSAEPVLLKVTVQTLGSSEHEVRTAAVRGVRGRGPYAETMANEKTTPIAAMAQTISHVLGVFVPTPFPDIFATSISPNPPLKRPVIVRKVASRT